MSMDTAKLRLSRWLEARAGLPDSTALNNHTFAELGMTLGDVREIADETDRLRKTLKDVYAEVTRGLAEPVGDDTASLMQIATLIEPATDAAIAAQPKGDGASSE